MISVKELYWAAGYIEGEGCFNIYKTVPSIQVAQVQKQPQERLVSLFGGKLRLEPSRKPKWNPAWKWKISNHKAVSIMMTLYPLLSPKRQAKIREILAVWKLSPVDNKFKTQCAKGHPYSAENTMLIGATRVRRKCKTCASAWQKDWYRRQKEAA